VVFAMMIDLFDTFGTFLITMRSSINRFYLPGYDNGQLSQLSAEPYLFSLLLLWLSATRVFRIRKPP